MASGAFIVGPGLPSYDLERELLREYYEKSSQGFGLRLHLSRHDQGYPVSRGALCVHRATVGIDSFTGWQISNSVICSIHADSIV